MKNCFLLLTILFFGINSYTQITIAVQESLPGIALTACGADKAFTITLTSSSSVTLTNANILINYQVPGISCTAASGGVSITNDSGNNNTVLTLSNNIPLQAGIPFTIDYSIHALCASISTNAAITELNDNLILNYNGLQSTGSINYNFNFPVITYDQSSLLNENLNIPAGAPFTRTLAVRNQGSAPFKGFIDFNDVFGPSANITNISVTASCGTYSLNTSQINIFSPSHVVVDFSTNPLPNTNDCYILFHVNVEVIGCAQNDAASSIVTIKWGCNNVDDFCQTITEEPNITMSGNAHLTWNMDDLNFANFECSDVPVAKSLIVTNNGSATAQDVVVSFKPQLNFSNSIIPSSSISFGSHMPSSSNIQYILDTDTDNTYFNNNCVNENHNADAVSYVEYTFSDVLPNESITINFNYIKCCANDADLFTFNDRGILHDWWAFNVDGNDGCASTNNLFTYNQTTDLKMTQQRVGLLNSGNGLIVSDIAGFPGEIGTIVIDNVNFVATPNTYVFSEASFEVDLSIEYGLNYVPGTLKFVAVDGTEWFPELDPPSQMSCETQLNTSLNAVFDWSSRFSSYLEMKNFIDGSKLKFDVESCCGAHTPSVAYTEHLYMVASNSCSPKCRVPLSRVEHQINVHCPGCVTPGIIGTDFNIVRTTLGLQDDDYNGLPDCTGCPPDLNKIQKQRAVVGDHLRATWSSYFVDGDNGNGGINYATLQSQNGVNFTRCYLYTQFTQANRVRPLGQSGIVGCTSDPYIPTGLVDVLINGLLADVTTNIMASADNKNFLIELTGLAIENLHTNDDIQVIVDYELYGNQHAMSIEPIDFNGRMYLTEATYDLTTIDGIQEAGIVNQEAAGPAGLDGTEGYICEGFAGSFFQVAFTADEGGAGLNTTYENFDFDHLTNYPHKNYCKKRIKASTTAHMGLAVTDLNRLFPYEYRQVDHVQQYEVPVPAGYELKRAFLTTDIYKFENGVIVNNNSPCSNLDELDVSSLINNGGYITIPVLPNQLAATNIYPFCPSNNHNTVYVGNLYSRSEVVFDFVPICEEITESVYPGDIYVTLANQAQPLTHNNLDCPVPVHTKLPQFHTTNPDYDRNYNLILPNLTLTDNTSTIQVCSNREFSWDVTLLNTAQLPQEPYADNIFMWLENIPTNLTITQVMDVQTTTPLTLNSNQIYELPDLINGHSRQYRIFGTYSCTENLGPTKTFTVVYGLDCDGYPESKTDQICLKKELELSLKEIVTVLTAEYSEQPTGVFCENELDYQVKIKPTNICDVDYQNFTIILPECLSYGGNSILTFDGVEYPITPILTTPNLVWNIASLGLDFDDKEITIDFTLNHSGCSATIPPLQSYVNANTFCGDETDVSFVSNPLPVDYSACISEFTVTKSANPTTTYAGSPVDFMIEICNNSDNDMTVMVEDFLPSDFTLYNSSSNPFPPNTSIVLAPGCQTWHVYGFFRTVGGCEPSHTNTVVVTDQYGVTIQDTACVKVLMGCPANVSGYGGCVLGDEARLAIVTHVPLVGISEIKIQYVYPDFLAPPVDGLHSDHGQLSNLYDLSLSSISDPQVWGLLPSGITYNYVDIHLVFPTPVNLYTEPDHFQRFLELYFTVQGTPPVNENTFLFFVNSPTSGLNHTDVLNQQGVNIITDGIWTASNWIILQGCQGVDALDANFSVQHDVCNTHGAVTVTANYDAPGIIHNWTWGDGRTTPINGAVTYTYNYFDEITENTGVIIDPAIPAASPGTYTITHDVIDLVNGTSSTSTQTVTLNALPSVVISSNSPVSASCDLNLNASGTYSYNWSGPNGFASNLQNPSIVNVNSLAAGTYIVVATDNNSCSTTKEAMVVVNPSDAQIVASSENVCTGSSIALTASGGNTYLWSNGATAASITVSPQETTTYSVTTSMSGICSGKDSITIVVEDCCPTICEPYGANLITNGDFALKAVSPCIAIDFSSQYSIDCSAPFASNINRAYAIDNTVIPWVNTVSPWFAQDHTIGGNTNFFLGRVRVKGDSKAWYKNVTVQKGKNYVFSAWVKNIVNNTGSRGVKVNLIVNGQNIETMSEIYFSQGWVKICGDYHANATGTIELAIGVNSSSMTEAFALDDIDFRLAGPIIDAGPDKEVCRGQNFTLSANTLIPGYTYSWSHKLGVLTIIDGNSPTITTSTLVNTIYTLSMTSPDGCVATDEVSITMLPALACKTGNPSVKSNDETLLVEDNLVKVYPNPFNTKLNFEYTSTECVSLLIEIYDLNGRIVASVFQGITEKDKKYHFEYDTFKLPNGAYQYQITSNGKKSFGKLIRIDNQ